MADTNGILDTNKKETLTIDNRNINQLSREELMDVLLYIYHRHNDILDLEEKNQEITYSYHDKIEEIKKDDFAVTIGLKVAIAIWCITIILIILACIFLPEGGPTILNSIMYTLVIGISGFLISIVVGFILIALFSIFDPTRKKKKEEINKIEQELFGDEDLLENKQEIARIQTENALNFYKNKIPENFLNIEDIVGMWILLNDFRASNFQEAANLVREEQFRNTLLNSFGTMQEKVENLSVQLNDINDNIENLNRLTEEQIELLKGLDNSVNENNKLISTQNLLLCIRSF